MVIVLDDMEIHIIETTKRKLGYRGGVGWYWADSRLPPVGSFCSAADAVRDFADHLEDGRLQAALDAKAAARRAKGYAT